MTWRVLDEMAVARLESEWERTSWILAKIHNAHISKRGDAIQPQQINPMHKTPRMSQEEIAENRRAIGRSLAQA